MINASTKFLNRMYADGPMTVSRYVAYRVKNEFLLRRFGLGKEVREANLEAARSQNEAMGPGYGGFFPTPMWQFLGFRTAMKRFVHATGSDVFLDYGSGLGGVVMMAATLPFRKVVGVELSAALNGRAAEIFERNKSRLICQSVEFITMDATQYDISPDVTVIYFYNPFWGSVLQGVVAKIRQSIDEHPRDLRMVWFYDPTDDITSRLAADLPGLVSIGEVKYPDCVPSAGNSFKVFTIKTPGRVN